MLRSRNNNSSNNMTALASSPSNKALIEPPKQNPEKKPPLTPFTIKAIGIASLGGILFGYDLGVISGALPQLTSSFDLSQTQQESIVSFLYLGGGFGALVGGVLCDALGRRVCILCTDVIFTVGALILACSNAFSTLLLGRFVVGFGVSTSGIADVAYLHEISPLPSLRGALVSCNEACISLGFLLSYTSGYMLSLYYPVHGWRIMFGLSCVVALMQFAGMVCMPESPVWLESKGRKEEAALARRRIGGGFEEVIVLEENESGKDGGTSYSSIEHHGVDDHTSTSKVSLPPSVTSSSQDHAFLSSICRTVQICIYELSQHYPQALIALFLTSIQQFCGHPNVLNFAPKIFVDAGLMTKSSLASTLFLGVMKFSVTVLVIWKIEVIGRRNLLLSGMTAIAGSLFLLAVSFHREEKINDETVATNFLAVLGVIGVVAGYAASFGPLTWLITSEMFPTQIRGRALGVSTIITYLCASIVSYTFLTGQTYFGQSIPFFVYFGITSTSLMFAYLGIPDTGGGRSPESIDLEIRQMWIWKKVDECCCTDAHHPSVVEISNHRPSTSLQEDKAPLSLT